MAKKILTKSDKNFQENIDEISRNQDREQPRNINEAKVRKILMKQNWKSKIENFKEILMNQKSESKIYCIYLKLQKA
jgi:hypothetical protein